MARKFYSKRHYDRLSNGGPDTAESIAQRKAHYAAFAKLNEEMEARFPQPWTHQTISEIATWQPARLAELIKEYCHTQL